MRKLSLTILLSDPSEFDGGDLIVWGSPTTQITTEKKLGRAYAFPSFIPHHITPVTSGIRKSLVIWVVGPKFV